MDYITKQVDRADIRDFIEAYHYSKSINGCISDYCFALYSAEGFMIGAMFYGRMAMANQWCKYGDNAADVIELRRLVLVDDTLCNAESYFIGASLKLLASAWNPNGVVVSYADSEHGHSGVVYKASNFCYRGSIPGARVIVHNGKRYHDKTIRTKYKGELKPFAKRVKDALESGEAYYKCCAVKHVYVYFLNKKQRKLAISANLI